MQKGTSVDVNGNFESSRDYIYIFFILLHNLKAT